MINFVITFTLRHHGEIKMEIKPSKEISRREALKILGAVAGAAALANLPSKWSKPELLRGTLPAHAQTSPTGSLIAGLDNDAADFCSGFITSTVAIDPAVAGITLRYTIVLTGAGLTIALPVLLTDTLVTLAGGLQSLDISGISSFAPGDTIAVTWEFEDPADGVDSDTQIFTSALDFTQCIG